RRRHTRFSRDWSSDVCSSDLYLRTRDNSVSEILVGLLHPKKRIHPKFFYDDRGAELFDRITVTEDYYPTNAELEILQNNAADLAAAVGSNGVLVEPGCGSCTKVMALLPHLCPAMYVPIDIASQPVQHAAQQLVERFPYLRCTAIAADFVDLSFLPQLLPALPRTVFYPGSTIGNFEPAAAIVFLRGLRAMIGRDGGLLIGVDKENSEDILNQAYNDREGITEKFNLNILENVNRTAVANFEVRNFKHEAFYNASEHRVEMHLRSTCIQSVTVAGQKIEFTKGEL